MLDTETIPSSAKPPSKVETGFIHPRLLLWMQRPVRLDFAIRDFAIGEILGENDFGIDLWKKLGRKTRIPFQTRLKRLQNLMKSFKERGYSQRIPIGTDRFLQLSGASHRLLLCLRYDIEKIKIKRRRNFKHRNDAFVHCYNNFILLRLGYTVPEIEIIWDKTNELYRISKEVIETSWPEGEIFWCGDILSELREVGDTRCEAYGEQVSVVSIGEDTEQ